MGRHSTQENLSRHLAFLLRHTPEFVNSEGWASISSVTSALSNKAGREVTAAEVREIVQADAKGRYSIHGERVRAVQGHSHPVELGLSPVEPPEILYHGTTVEAATVILTTGILPRTRTHVHLSQSVETAAQVGTRHKGELALLAVRAFEAHSTGVEFFQAENGVWLSKRIPAEFVSLV